MKPKRLLITWLFAALIGCEPLPAVQIYAGAHCVAILSDSLVAALCSGDSLVITFDPVKEIAIDNWSRHDFYADPIVLPSYCGSLLDNQANSLVPSGTGGGCIGFLADTEAIVGLIVRGPR
jgi:hypothetical protein